MTDPLTTSIATAVVAGVTAAVSDGVRTLIGKLASVVQERFRRSPSDQEILDSATSEPRDSTTVERLAVALDRHMREDPAFAQQIRTLWTDIEAAGSAARDNVSNVVSGQVYGNLVQARDVQGGITFN